MLLKKYSFPKQYRVIKKHTVSDLFDSKNTFLVFPYKVIVHKTELTDSSLKVLISIPKNKQKKAVDRNRLKRQTREAWRQQCVNLRDIAKQMNLTYIVGLIYVHNKKLNTQEIKKSIEKVFAKLLNDAAHIQ